MANSWIQEKEEEELLRHKELDRPDNTLMIFNTAGSSGDNSPELARILSTFDLLINLLGWQDKPLAKFTNIVTQYQASLSGKYHNDFKDVKIAQEIERRLSERKGVTTSILNQR